MVIASQTTGASSVVKPLGRCTCYIVDRADLAALAAAGTDVRIDGKFLVGNHVTIEVLADDIGEEAGRGTLVELCYAAPAVSYDAGYVLRLSAGLFYLLAFTALGVGIHERQADVAFGHDDGKQRLGFQLLAGQFAVQDVHRLSRAVATGGQRPNVGGRCGVERGTTDEVADDSWRLPAVGRKAEAQTLVV